MLAPPLEIANRRQLLFGCAPNGIIAGRAEVLVMMRQCISTLSGTFFLSALSPSHAHLQPALPAAGHDASAGLMAKANKMPAGRHGRDFAHFNRQGHLDCAVGAWRTTDASAILPAGEEDDHVRGGAEQLRRAWRKAWP